MNRTFFRILIGSTLVSGVFASGCANPAPEPTLEELAAMEPRYNSTGSVILNGRPVDLDAAVRWSVSRVEPGLTVVNITTPNPHEREYELLSVVDEQGWLMIRTPDDSPISLWSQVSQRLVAHAKIGRFDTREQARERELLRVLNGRLEGLAGGG